MEISLPFPAEIVKSVFLALEQYEAVGTFPIVSPDGAKNILECTLYLGFDAYLRYLAPLIAQNIKDIDDNVIKQFPLFLREDVVNAIPASVLDPDFVIEHFGISLLQKRVERSPVPKLNDIPFGIATQISDNDPNHGLANALLYYGKRFASSKFVRANATQLVTKQVMDLTGFANIREILMFKGKLEGVFLTPMLVPTLEKLEIMKTKLEPWQFKEIYEVLKKGNLRILTLKDVKMKFEQCKELLNTIRGMEHSLTFLDISGNALGSTIIKEVLDVASKAGIQRITVDDNFLEPDAAALKPLLNATQSAVSVRGLHWEEECAVVMSSAMKNQNVRIWDISAQTIHKHSDPDMSPEMAASVLRDANPLIESLFVSNHKMYHADLSCLVHMQLKALTLSNSSLQEDSLAPIVPMLSRLVLLDLSDNSIVFRRSDFIASVASSQTLQYLFLSDNAVGDAYGRVLFAQMLESRSHIKTLRLRKCSLKNKSSYALMQLLASGQADFDELDVGANEMFHIPYNQQGPFLKSRVQCLFVDANNSHELGLWQALSVVSGMKFISLDRTRWTCVRFCSSLLKGVIGLSMCCMKIVSDTDLVRVLQDSQAQDLWVVNSLSTKTLSDLLARHNEIPRCMTVHVGPDMSDLALTSPIPLAIESL